MLLYQSDRMHGWLDRKNLRVMLKAQYSLDMARQGLNNGTVRQGAFDRFYVLWAWSTATEHPLTHHASLERWQSRRERICRAIDKIC